MLPIDYGGFRYPRTLPLKASATDVDLLETRCEPCDGSSVRRAIADEVHPGEAPRSGYRWTLAEGFGSLRTDVGRAVDEFAHERFRRRF